MNIVLNYLNILIIPIIDDCISDPSSERILFEVDDN